MVRYPLLLILFISIFQSATSQKIKFVNEKWEELDQDILLMEFQKQYDHIRDSFGLSRLKFNKTCDSVAKGHAIYMAKTGEFKHGKGDLNFSEMINYFLGRKLEGKFYENIIKIPGPTWTKKSRDNIPYEHIEKQIGDFEASLFLGKDISYSDLVKSIIDGWMESPGHRKCLLNQKNSQFSLACKAGSDNSFYACFNAF
jgi:uncharacterized protein YkwD